MRRIPAGVIIGIIIVALAIGAGIVSYRLRSSTGQPSSSSGPASLAATERELDLPIGSPLPATQLIAPRYDKSGAPSQLWRIDTVDSSASTHLDAVQDGSAYGIGMSADRRTITYVDGGANALRAMPAVGGTGRRLFPSPDGCGKIAHASWSLTDPAVFVLECQIGSAPRRFAVVDIEGTVIRQLDTGELWPSDPTISPDGTEIAFWATDSESDVEGGSIFVMPIDGSAAPTPVTDSAKGVDNDPAWSPDGTSLALRRRVGDHQAADTDIVVVPVAGGSPRTVVTGPAADEKPTWSPDGRTIAFVSDRDADGAKTDRKDLWLVPADGGKPMPMGLESYTYATPTWWHR